MRKYRNCLAAVLAACLLLAATGTLAAKEEPRPELALKQVSRKAPIYVEPNKKAAKRGYIARGMAVTAQDPKNGFWKVRVGPIDGFVESKYLIDPNDGVTIVSFASVKDKTLLVKLPNRPDDKSVELSAGQPVCVMTSIGDIIFIKTGEKMGMVLRENLLPYDEKSPAVEWVEMRKRTDIKNGEGKNAARLARANKGNWVAVLYKLGDEKAIVRHGEIIGVMSLKYTKLVESKPVASPLPNLIQKAR